jgi:hypothetical protein
MRSEPRLYNEQQLRKKSLKSEKVNLATSPKVLGPEKEYAGEDQQHIQKTDSSSRQRGRPRKTRP